MITKMTGHLARTLDEEVRLQVGPLEYQVLVPEFVRRVLQDRVGSEVTLHVTEYLEGNPMQGRMVPRRIGFLADAELEFFELFCTVDKVGVRKAMKALVRPIREIAEAIQRQDNRWLSTLPGVGPATAEKIVATLRKKVARFSLVADSTGTPTAAGGLAGPVFDEAFQALLALGMSPVRGPRSEQFDLVRAGRRCEADGRGSAASRLQARRAWTRMSGFPARRAAGFVTLRKHAAIICAGGQSRPSELGSLAFQMHRLCGM